jgi:hypothetical protein
VERAEVFLYFITRTNLSKKRVDPF